MSRLNYLNVGCGNKFHEAWTNVDMHSNSPHVISHNLLRGLPFPDDQFDVVYHSQVLEHFAKEDAPSFVRECFRVLKPGGIMRVVVPDLENIVNEYRNRLRDVCYNPSRLAEANYDWIMLEMYDQTVRNCRGGQMAEYLKQPELINEQYVIDRIGYMGRSIRNDYLSTTKKTARSRDVTQIAKGVLKRVLRAVDHVLSSRAKRIGRFRLGGEVHMWMYDRYSLSRLLGEAGFEHMETKTPFASDVPQWETYELDVKDGAVFDPAALFMEAKKPR